jgi:2-aminoadipate transaminase
MSELTSLKIRFSEMGDRLAAPVITRLMAAALDSPELLSLAAGFTDTTTLPGGLVGEVVGKLVGRPGPPEYLQYGTNQGRPLLRNLLVRRLSEQDRQEEGVYQSNQLFIANGSQQALSLATQVLCDPGDIVLVERPTYFVYLDVLRGLGVEARCLPWDKDHRLDGEALEDYLERMERAGELERVKAVYLQAYYANPTARSLEPREKAGLAEALLAKGLRIPVIEDAAYRELHFENPPAASSVLAMPEFADFPCLYLGTLTKPFATGLKVGFGYCSHQGWLDRILFLKGQQDFGTSNFCQAILEEVLAGGQYDSYLPELRRHYHSKMQVLDQALREEGLSELGWEWEVPEGGLYLWLQGPQGFNTRIDSAFCHQCLMNGVLYVPGDLCFGNEVENRYVRLSFGVLSGNDLREAGRRFVETVRQLTPA